MYKEIVQMEAEGLDEGTSTRIVCPFCNSKEKTMSLSLKDGHVLFNCFRASCNKRGRVNLPGVLDGYKEELRGVESKNLLTKNRLKVCQILWSNGTYKLPSNTVFIESRKRNWRVKNSLSPVYNTKYNFNEDVLIVKVDNGYVVRSYANKPRETLTWLDQTKTVNVLNGPNSGLLLKNHTLEGTTNSKVYLVEDILSAIAIHGVLEDPGQSIVYKQRAVFCLFGTNVTDEMFEKISSYSTWVWCLDNDTNYGRSQKYSFISDRFPLQQHSWRVLDKDPKNMTISEIHNLL